MCGRGGAYERLRAAAGDCDNILWLPLQPLERLNELLNMADVHLLPQRADAADLVMPSKLTGMLSSGKPVLATAFEGTEVWEVVQGRGLVVPPDDVAAFCAALERLLDNEPLRHEMGGNARHYAEAYLCNDAILAGFEAQIQELVLRGKK
jgi:colanic acid biosynthesis glycosyl transferase WcaI